MPLLVLLPSIAVFVTPSHGTVFLDFTLVVLGSTVTVPSECHLPIWGGTSD